MTKIADYVFYRMYIAYLKKDDPALFTSILFISTCYFSIFFPLIGTLGNLMKKGESHKNGYIILVYGLLIIFFVGRRYIKNRDDILRRYSKSKYNKSVPTWMIYIIVPICMVLGIGLFIVIMKTVIRPYNLTGYLYNLMCG